MYRVIVFFLFIGIFGCGTEQQAINPFSKPLPNINSPIPSGTDDKDPIVPDVQEDLKIELNKIYEEVIADNAEKVFALLTSTYEMADAGTSEVKNILLKLPGNVPEKILDYIAYSYFPLSTDTGFTSFSDILPADRKLSSYVKLDNWIGSSGARDSLRKKLYLSGGSATAYNLKGTSFGGSGFSPGVQFVNGNYSKKYQFKVLSWLDEIGIYNDASNYDKNPIVLSFALRIPWIGLRKNAKWPDDVTPSERKRTDGLADGLEDAIEEWLYITYKFSADEFRNLLYPKIDYTKHRLESEFIEIKPVKDEADKNYEEDSDDEPKFFEKYDTILLDIKVKDGIYENPNPGRQSTFSGSRLTVKSFDYGLLFIGSYEMSINAANEFLGFRIPIAMSMGQLSRPGAPSITGLYSGKIEAKLRNFGAPIKAFDSSIFKDPASIGFAHFVGNIEIDINSQGINRLSITLQDEKVRAKKDDGSFDTVATTQFSSIISFKNKGNSQFDITKPGSPFFLELTKGNKEFVGIKYDGRLAPLHKVFDNETGYIQGAFYGPNKEFIAGVISYRAGYLDKDGDEDSNTILYGAYAIQKHTP